MRVFNQSKTEELQEYDQSLGYLQNDTLVTHFPEVQAVKEQGHYKVIAEYPNGGKDVEWIVDVEGVEYQPEHDEEEDILVYICFNYNLVLVRRHRFFNYLDGNAFRIDCRYANEDIY